VAVSFSDIAQLGLNGEPDQIDWNQYQDAQAIPPAVPDGVYTVQAPQQILFDKWEKDGRSYLKIAASQGETGPLTITDEGPAKGAKLFYPFITTRKYKNKMGSAFGDYLRSFGILAQPNSDAEYAQLAQATAGRFGKVQTKQEGYCKDCDETVFEGQAAFGGATSKPCPHCNKPVYARAKVDRFLSAAV
jgi:hypothetical protein